MLQQPLEDAGKACTCQVPSSQAVYWMFSSCQKCMAVVLQGGRCDRLLCLQLTASVVEIYCERIRDLISAEPGAGEGLAVQQDRVRGIVIPGACEVPVRSEGELMRLMQLGLARRMVACTGMNAGSSRSHCVVLLRLMQAQQDGCVLHSKLCLVDLAGMLSALLEISGRSASWSHAEPQNS